MDATIWWRSPRLMAAALCLCLGSLVLAAGLLPHLAAPAPMAAEDDPLDSIAEPLPQQAAPAPELVVYVTGAVQAPDVYRLPAGARVKDAVVAAGGLRPDAADERVNLAETLSDAQQVHIPPRDEAPAAPDATAGGAAAELIDLNRASAAELEELPGVGATLAERIIARREADGPFTALEQLREVSGVGAKLYEQIAPLVRVGS